jgi:hypothetical protein
MPVYYFDVTENDEEIPDTEGTDLPDLESARVEATQTIAELAKERIPNDGLQHSLAIIVRDEEGRSLVSLHLAFYCIGLA